LFLPARNQPPKEYAAFGSQGGTNEGRVHCRASGTQSDQISALGRGQRLTPKEVNVRIRNTSRLNAKPVHQ
jgi:hypothetical protein